MSNPIPIDLTGLLLSSIILISGWVVYVGLCQVFKLLNNSILVLSIIAFLFPFVVLIIEQIVPFRSVPPDAYIYSEIISDYWNKYDAFSFGVKGYSILNLPLFLLCFGRPFVFISFNIIMYHLGVLFIYLAYQRLSSVLGIYVNKKAFFFTLFLSIIYPVGLFTTITLLRESSMVFFFGLSLYLIFNYLKSDNYSVSLGQFALGLFIVISLFLIRPITGVSVLIVLLVVYLYKNVKLSLLKVLQITAVFIFGFILVKKLILSVYDLNFSFAWLESYRVQSAVKYGSEGYGILKWENFYSSLKNVILLFTQYLFSPLPILVPYEVTLNKIIPLVDAFFIIFLLLLTLITRLRSKFLWIVAFLIIIGLPALFETNISGAYRHRLNGVLLLFPVAAVALLRFKTANKL